MRRLIESVSRSPLFCRQDPVVRGGQALRRYILRSLSVVLLFALGGCSAIDNMMYKTTGDVMVGFAKQHAVPYVLASDDLQMSCAMSEAMTPLLMAFGRVTAHPDQLAVMMEMSAGTCEEEKAWNAELAYMKSLRNQKPQDAEDEMIIEKRHLILASNRYFSAWKHMVTYYGDPADGKCPSFDNDEGQFIYMAGLISGLQALASEIQSTSDEGVPKNIGSTVAQATGCLSDDKWWGVPMALRATVWAMLPGAKPKGEEPFLRLKQADQKANAARVRLAYVMHAIAAWNKGDTKMVKQVIREQQAQVTKLPANPKWKMIDKLSTRYMQAISDRMWVEHTGHRTPIGGLGTFWDDKKNTGGEVIDLDSVL